MLIKAKNKKDIIKTLKKVGETVLIAKAEIMYAFPRDFFPNQTIEEVIDQIKNSPESYKYYKVGSIKIEEIEEI